MPAFIQGWHRWVGVGLLAVFVFTGTARADTAALFSAPGIKPARVVDSLTKTFGEVVFGSETNLQSRVVAKWQGPVGIALQGRVTETYAGFLQTHLRTLAGLTGLRFAQVKPDDPGQKITIAFVRRSEMASINLPGVDPALVRRLAASGGCYFLSFKKPEDRIIFAVIVVNVDRDPALTNSCLLEEVAQSLGLPNDTDLMRPSIFSDRDHVTSLSPSDRALVRALYDPRMKAGLPPGEALAVARALFSEMAEAAQ